MSKLKNITTPADLEELKKSYQFIVESTDDDYNGCATSTETSCWQDRMVIKYHQHLYKTFVVADLSRYEYSQIGLRWRTKSEVDDEKGVESCGNKHCPCYFEKDRKKSAREIREWRKSVHEEELVEKYIKQIPTKEDDDPEHAEDRLIQCLPYGIGLCDYEVHFAYVEKGQEKEELVKLRLCLRCAPKLFFGKEGSLGARKAREKKDSFWTKDCHRFKISAKETNENMEHVFTEKRNVDRKRRGDKSNENSNIPALQKRRQETI